MKNIITKCVFLLAIAGFTDNTCFGMKKYGNSIKNGLLLAKEICAAVFADGGINERLLYAAEEGKLETIKVLLQYGADIEAKDGLRRTPIVLAAYWNHREVVMYLRQQGAYIGRRGRTFFHFAAFWNQDEIVKHLIQQENADIEAKDEDGKTALHFAANHGNNKLVEYLLSEGANIEARDNDGRTPLLDAAAGGHDETVTYLLSKGAHIKAQDKNGWTLLQWAARKGDSKLVTYLLSKGANSEAKGFYGRTPLLSAAVGGHLEVLRLLLSKGANIEAQDENGWTSLHWAVEKGHDKIALLLCQQFLPVLNPDIKRLKHFLAMTNKKGKTAVQITKKKHSKDEKRPAELLQKTERVMQHLKEIEEKAKNSKNPLLESLKKEHKVDVMFTGASESGW